MEDSCLKFSHRDQYPDPCTICWRWELKENYWTTINKVKGSRNWRTAQIKIARLHHKIANIRKDTLHKLGETGSERRLLPSTSSLVDNCLALGKFG